MSKHHKDPRLEALEQGQPVTWKVPEGGDLASMRNIIKHGQLLTFAPITDVQEIRAGDIVYVKWRGSHIMHLVQEIQGNQFLIVNSLGKINGWVNAGDILGRVTHITDPEPCPDLPDMLEMLETAYRHLCERSHAKEDDTQRLLRIIDDLHWYADRLGRERWNQIPRPNKWNFEQNVWYFTKEVRDAAISDSPCQLQYYIDHGKECVGLAAEIIALLEYGEAY